MGLIKFHPNLFEEMKPDEIEYLKSGSQDQYDDFMICSEDVQINEKKWNEIYALNDIIGEQNCDLQLSFAHENVKFFWGNFFNLTFKYNKNLFNRLNDIDVVKSEDFPILSVFEKNGDKYISYRVPKEWLSELNLGDNLQNI